MCSAGCHIHKRDNFDGLWAVLARVTVALPEFGILLELGACLESSVFYLSWCLGDGDVLSFDTASIWHCCVHIPECVGPSVILSMYFSHHQYDRFWDYVSTFGFDDPDGVWRCPSDEEV